MSAVAQSFSLDARWGGVAPRPPSGSALLMVRIEAATPGVGRDARFLKTVVSDESSDKGNDHRLDAVGPTWLNEVYSLVGRNKIDSAIDMVFRQFDALLSAGNYDRSNSVLRAIDVNRLDTNLMLSVLTITLRAKERLTNRPRFLERVERHLRQVEAARAERLLVGLR